MGWEIGEYGMPADRGKENISTLKVQLVTCASCHITTQYFLPHRPQSDRRQLVQSTALLRPDVHICTARGMLRNHSCADSKYFYTTLCIQKCEHGLINVFIYSLCHLHLCNLNRLWALSPGLHLWNTIKC